GFTTLNEISSVGAFLLSASMIPVFYNVWKTARSPKVRLHDPWGWGRSLEWATSCPPTRHNIVTLPRIRTQSTAYDIHHPEVSALVTDDNRYNDELTHMAGSSGSDGADKDGH